MRRNTIVNLSQNCIYCWMINTIWKATADNIMWNVIHMNLWIITTKSNTPCLCPFFFLNFIFLHIYFIFFFVIIPVRIDIIHMALSLINTLTICAYSEWCILMWTETRERARARELWCTVNVGKYFPCHRFSLHYVPLTICIYIYIYLRPLLSCDHIFGWSVSVRLRMKIV